MCILGNGSDNILMPHLGYQEEDNFLRACVANSRNNSEGHKKQNISGYWASSFTPLTDGQRVGFFIVYLLIFTISITSNIATIFVTFRKRKLKPFQKTWTLSLALSDIVVAVFLGGNNLVMLSHPMTNWVMGKFMCTFVPYMQNSGQIVNSITMAIIAFDRYRNIVHSLDSQWDPKIWMCCVIFFFTWAIPLCITIPQWDISYLFGPTFALSRDPKNSSHIILKEIYVCLYSLPKERQLIFYSLIGCVSFLPLMFLFLWMYFQIAMLIWKIRKPPSDKYNNNSVTMETSTGDTKTSMHSVSRKKSIIKSSKLHVEKKIRTFKIILVTMFVFFLCRMPHWIFNVVRFSISADKPIHWIMSYVLSFLLLVNTAMNPYLYTFLSQSIIYFDKVWTSIGEFISNICCCCCCSTSEFDDYEKDNSFFVQHIQEQRPSQSSNIIPRGPYVDYTGKINHNHVTFDDKAVINTYPTDDNKNIGYGLI